jgi:hypothetical protein
VTDLPIPRTDTDTFLAAAVDRLGEQNELLRELLGRLPLREQPAEAPPGQVELTEPATPRKQTPPRPPRAQGKPRR